MSFQPAFGSFGDFLSIAILIKDIATALDDSRGSAKKYQDLLQNLDILSKTIQAVEHFYRGPRHAEFFDSISVTALHTVEQIRRCLEDFRAKTRRYASTLCPGGSGSVTKDFARKIQFKVLDEKDIESFRVQVLGYNMLLKTLLDVSTL